MRVIALAAMTADGRIARREPGPVNWSSREDKRMFVQVTRRAGVVIMGRTTYDSLPMPLAGRRVVVLTTRAAEQQLSQSDTVEFTSGTPKAIIADLAARGYTEAVVAGGASVYQAFLEAGVVDELWLTIEPLLFGDGLPLLRRETSDISLRLLEVVRLAEHTVQLKYRVLAGGDGRDGGATVYLVACP